MTSAVWPVLFLIVIPVAWIVLVVYGACFASHLVSELECDYCGHLLEPDAVWCPNCLTAEATAYLRDKETTVWSD